MAVKGEMTKIDEAIDEALGTHERRQAKEKAKSRRQVYKKALNEVQQTAGKRAMRRLSDWIQEQIRQQKQLPSGRAVRKHGAKICRDEGHPVSTGSWLGA